MPHLPCLNVGRPNKDIWMPLELCTVVKGQQGRMKLDPSQQDKMVQVATQGPANRLNWIDKCINQHANLDTDGAVRAWGLKLQGQMATVGPQSCRLSVKHTLTSAPALSHATGQDHDVRPWHG